MNKKAMTRGFHIDGETYYFNFKEFQRAFRNYNLHINQETTTLTKCEELLAEKLGIGPGTVHGWRYEKNGPKDLDTVKELSAELGLESHMELLYTNEHMEEDKCMENTIPVKITVTERQLDSLKKIYDAFIIFLDEYGRTEGFNDYCPDFNKIKDLNQRNSAKMKFYMGLHDKIDMIALVYQQETVVLHQLDMEDLEDLLYEDLIELYMDQLNHGFRFNAKIREDHTWTEVPWDVAKDYILDKLNEFMFQYF